jgi:hypothetical protein
MSALKVTNLLTKALTGNGAKSPLGQSSHFSVYLFWPPGTSAGVVQIETAPYAGYTGTWANLTSFTWATADSYDVWRGTGPFGAIRARISTTVVSAGDGVSADLWEN